MRKIYVTSICLILLMSIAASAQYTRFVSRGEITFEKRVNTYAIIKNQIKDAKDNSWIASAFESYQKNNPQFKTVKSKLSFTPNKTLFTPEEEAVMQGNSWFNISQAQQNNIILTNIASRTSLINKKVYEQTYIVSDSVRNINWKITDEYRNIAGYNCRRANAMVMDSVYVVAFYTDEILTSGGPENFSGLPGMILGVALPHDHVTWFATTVTETPVEESKLNISMKGKAVSNKELYTTLKGALKGWGKWANEVFKWSML